MAQGTSMIFFICLDCRYLSAAEAAWRIYEFDMQERYPSVMRLPVHL
ncbi:hypothetical protein KSS87_008769, partial [Heliosperma pusillum]